MTTDDSASTKPAAPAESGSRRDSTGWFARTWREWTTLRKPVPTWQAVFLGVLCIAACGSVWWFITLGDVAEERLVSPASIPSPRETFSKFHDLWFEYELTRSTVTTIARVTLGFFLSVAIGVPLGIVAGCFPRVNSFLSPLVMFGRNIPIAAILPLLVLVFKSGESLKIMFIFFASVAFVLSDTARAISDVATRYIDTAYTLGANRWQTVMKVLVPLALPSIFSSCRLLYGLAFGYIMLAEAIKNPDEPGGLGFQINTFQRLGLLKHIYLILLIIPLVALLIDQLLYLIQRQLFPYAYGGEGYLHMLVRGVIHVWDDCKSLVFKRNWPADQNLPSAPVPPESKS